MTHPVWEDAVLALRLLRLDPVGLGGIWLRAAVGPPHDRFIRAVGPAVRLTCHMTDEALLGGLDIPSTLANGRPSYAQGLLAKPGCLMLSCAERASRHLAAVLARTLDRCAGHSLIALDEGIDDEAPPAALTDRLAFHLVLDGLSAADCVQSAEDMPESGPTRLAGLQDEALRALTAISVKLGVTSLRAPMFAARTARAHAALHGRPMAEDQDLETAVRLVLVPRATMVPQEDPAESPPPDDPPPPSDADTRVDKPAEDQLLEAALANLPPDILSRLCSQQRLQRAAGTSAQGALMKGSARGRPLPSRPGRLDGRSRIDLIATLRAAAPWQPLRRGTLPGGPLKLRSSDLHVRRNQSRSDRLLIFAVDASGSAAFNRLAEAKGAVELLLAEAYASRDHVALIAYNKESAELLLPPTRSLVRTKRHLAQLPGGGATPLAAGLKEALHLAATGRRKGFQPALILIADGRANIDLLGQANRANALSDALTTARGNRMLNIPAVVIDMSKRPEAQLSEVAQALDARYAPMPFADAKKLSGVVNAQLT